MLAILRRIFSKPEQVPASLAPLAQALPTAATPTDSAVIAAPESPAGPVLQEALKASAAEAETARSVPLAGTAEKECSSDRAASKPVAASSGSVKFALGALFPKLPESLRSAVDDLADEIVALPLERIVPQLATGSVSVSWHDIKAGLAVDLTGRINGDDETAVMLPLSIILAQLTPTQWPRRADQDRVDIPEEVTGLFDAGGRIVELRHAAASSAATQSAVTAPPLRPPDPVMPVAEPKLARSQQVQPSAVGAVPVQAIDTASSRPAGVRGSTLRIPLAALSGGWPIEIHQQIASARADAVVVLPVNEIETGLKAGRVMFPWRVLWPWVEPALNAAPSRSAGELLLELPLNVVAPLFVARQEGIFERTKVTLPADIPDLFNRGGLIPRAAPPSVQPLAIPNPGTPERKPPLAVAQRSSVGATAPGPIGAVGKQTATPMLSALPLPSLPKAALSVSEDLKDVLGDPSRRYSPREIVQHAARLPGITGALLAMTDGLLVTSALPPHLKGEMLAAFLPQIYGRMAQYSRDQLGLGDLKSLSLSVESGRLMLTKAGGIFFAVLEATPGALPASHFAAIAAELSRQHR